MYKGDNSRGALRAGSPSHGFAAKGGLLIPEARSKRRSHGHSRRPCSPTQSVPGRGCARVTPPGGNAGSGWPGGRPESPLRTPHWQELPRRTSKFSVPPQKAAGWGGRVHRGPDEAELRPEREALTRKCRRRLPQLQGSRTPGHWPPYPASDSGPLSGSPARAPPPAPAAP